MALTEAQKRNAEKNRRYWAEREAEALKHYITDEKEYDKEIKRIYQNMLDACQKEIESFYAKYASAEGISLAEAKKRVSKLDIAAYERKAAKYVKEKNFSKKANEEMRLYNATMKINRLEMLKANIGLETIAGHDELEKFMAGILKGRTMDELERQAGILGKTIRNNAAKAHAIVNGSFHSGTFSDRIWQYQDLMREDLGKLLQQGLIQGKGARAIAKGLKKYWYGNDPRTGGGATYCMERLMRTELARVQTEAQKQSFIENGVDYYVFRVNGGCCAICQSLSGKRFRVAKMMPGENAAPLHPHCRCSASPYVDVDMEELEAILDFVDQGGTYEEWNATVRVEWQKKKTLENSDKLDYNASKQEDLDSLSLRFMSNRDRTYKNLANVPPIDGYEDIAVHADPYSFGFVDPVTEETVQSADAKFFANRVRESEKYTGGNIRLIACESGKLDNGIAQQFANEMGVQVLAPTKIVYTNSQGFIVLADNDLEAAELMRKATEKWNPDGWRVFKPKEG